MQKDHLLEIKNKIEKFCKENSIVIFYGDVDASHTPSVEWEEANFSNWLDYLNILKQLNVKLLSLDTTMNILEQDETITNYYSSLEGDDKRLYKKALETVTKAKNHVATVSLSFFYNGVRYHHEMEAEWADQHHQVLEAYKHAILDEVDDEEEEDGRISEQRANEIARMLIEEERYIKAKPRDRFEIGKEILIERKGELDLKEMDFFNISWRAKKIFEKEVQPKLDKEIEKKVKELKLKGLSKTAVKGQLGITESTIGKYWYL